MKGNYRTIEDRLEFIENEILELKRLILQGGIRQKISPTPVTNHDHEQLMDVKEVCKLLKIESSKVYAACTGGELKHIKLGKLYKFKRGDVIKWLDQNKSEVSVDVDDYVEKYLAKNILKG